jgi:chromosomal replication initiator protein
MIMKAVWEKAKASLQDSIPAQSYRMWIEPIQYKHSSNQTLHLVCPNPFACRRVEDQYCRVIADEIERLSGQRVALRLAAVEPAVRPRPEPVIAVQQPLPGMNVRAHSGRYLRHDFTFEQFVVGGNNDFAYSASLALAARPNGSQNALFLMSKTGMGKSHLSQAIGHHVLASFSDQRVYYITAEDFTNELMRAFRKDTLGSFKQKYRNGCDILLLEDVHYISGKEKTQIELTYTLDSLMADGKKVIFSSCYGPSEIPRLCPELRSRLTSGLVSCIDPPDFKTRLRILKRKNSFHDTQVPMGLLHYLAAELTEDVRQLESGLIGLATKSSLLGRAADNELAESVVKTISSRRKKVTIEAIKQLICREYGLSAKALVSKSRKQKIVKPRQIAMYLARIYTDCPLQNIGRAFNRYHATALHAIHVVEKELKEDTAIRKQVELLRKKVESEKF